MMLNFKYFFIVFLKTKTLIL